METVSREASSATEPRTVATDPMKTRAVKTNYNKFVSSSLMVKTNKSSAQF